MSSTTPSASLPLRFAILDDYQSLGAAKFSSLASPPHNLQVDNHPNTLNTRDPTQRAEFLRRMHPYAVISAMRERTPFPAEVVNALPNLKLIMTTGSRNAAIDMDACRERGIVVTGTSGYGKREEAGADAGLKPELEPQGTTVHTWALILALTRCVPRYDLGISQGGWQGSRLAMSLPGKTLSVLGFGRLGADTARVGFMAFGMRVLAWSSSLTQEKADAKAAELGLPAGAVRVVGSKEELVRRADVLSVHYVLSARSRGMIGREELGWMKRGAVLVNTSRGPLVDEEALLECLKEGRIRGAALDVFDTEPLPRESEWRSVEWGRDGRSEVVLSPHMGYAEEDTLHAWYEEQAGILERWMKGEEIGPKLN